MTYHMLSVMASLITCLISPSCHATTWHPAWRTWLL